MIIDNLSFNSIEEATEHVVNNILNGNNANVEDITTKIISSYDGDFEDEESYIEYLNSAQVADIVDSFM